MNRKINIHIDELVLNGFSASDRYRIGSAVQAEIARIIAEEGIPSSFARSAEIERIDGGAFNIAPRARISVLGSNIAKAALGGLKR